MTSDLLDFNGFISEIPPNIPIAKHNIKPKTILVQRGDIVDRVYILISGSMVAYNEFENGNIIFVEKLINILNYILTSIII